jgi:hypothetical protein
VIGTDAVVRRLAAAGRAGPVLGWLLGVLAFLPAWVVTLIVLGGRG